ncbi:MAG: hypothetical protein LH613_17445 [Chamaesiphon sp.]|nr:hypothetical protein [Chamaesiphon sp.]
MSEIFQAISATKAAIDGVRSLHQYADEVKDVSKRGEFMRIIGELSIELAETQVRLSGHIRENDELKEQVVTLQKKVETFANPKSKLTFKDDAYYNSENDGPFCTGCYDKNQQTIRLSETPLMQRGLGKYECPICKSKYGQFKSTGSIASFS